MHIDIWLLFAGTVVVFMLTPGPSHILMLSNSISNGFNKSIATAAGDLSANFLQMALASLGLAGLLYEFEHAFTIIKWAGVAYLLYMGLRLFLSRHNSVQSGAVRSRKALYWQGFITSAANPKAVIFFAALFPQFISPDQVLLPQFLALSLTYLAIDGLFLCTYGKFADRFATQLNSRIGQHLNQISGVLLIVVAILLGLKSVETNSIADLN